MSKKSEWINQNKQFLIIIIIALLVRFYFFSISLSQIGLDGLTNAVVDSINYLKMADWLLGADIAYPEGRFFDWGIGHAGWLAGILFIFNSTFWIFIIQIILSSVSCGIIYKISLHLTEDKRISLLAGLLLAFSVTSINLSILILSDTLYFFLMLMGLYLFLKGLANNKWSYFVIAGFLSGYGVLTRSIGQFWFLIFIIITIIEIYSNSDKKNIISIYINNKKLIFKTVVSILIIIIITSFWVGRNYYKYNIPTLAFTSARSVANIAGWTNEKLTDQKARDFHLSWIEEYKSSNNLSSIPYGELYDLYMKKGKDYIYNFPIESFETYIRNCWENISKINMLHRATFPQLKGKLIHAEQYIKDNYLNRINFFLCMAGFIILLLKKKFRLFIILLIIYFYYALLIGGIKYQGSRLFYPAQLSAVILISTFFINIYEICKQYIIRRFSKE